MIDINYPELLSLKDKFMQDTLNRFLKNEFIHEDEIDISDCDPDIGSTLEINCYVEFNSSDLISIVHNFIHSMEGLMVIMVTMVIIWI
ncbi:MAG: hypothetical protein IPH11_11880 [Ignavibacteriales bacterium]|nr:hypothetical protein [Ignavibacteriales bacterium]